MIKDDDQGDFQQCTHLLKIVVIVYVFPLMRILQLVCFNVLPQSSDDDRTGLGMYPQETGQSRIQLVLRWLSKMIKVDVNTIRKILSRQYVGINIEFKKLN